MSKLCVVAAGGTGGHMFPAEALAREMAARGWHCDQICRYWRHWHRCLSLALFRRFFG